MAARRKRERPGVKIVSGPSKARRPPSPRLDHHKTRSAWFRARAAWPVREAPIRTLVQERHRVRRSLPPAPGAAQWQLAGPTNIGGRLTSIVCDAAQPQRIWIGAGGGGVWFSPDGGASWQSQWHDQDVLNVGALAIHPQNPDVLYCGTGEANLSADSYPGVGLYRTLDGGQSWHLFASCERAGLPRRIGVVAIDPFDPQHILLGGIGFLETSRGEDLGGLYTSFDGGVSWRRETFVSPRNYWCHAVVFHPRTAGTIYATVTARGAASGIYRTRDDGRTWTHLTKGLPPGERLGRTSLAISPSDPKVLYAFAADEASAYADLLLGVFRTANDGDAWKNVAGDHFAAEGQISYGNTIVVHPTDPNQVICGGVDLHRSTNGGRTWRQITRWDDERGKPTYAHADHHALLMPAAVPGLVYDPNDGGLDVSEDGGTRWTNRSNGLAVTMFYDLDVAQSDARVYGGGAQDNGTLVTTSGRPNEFFELLGGDGGWIVFDPREASHVYASYYNLNIYRFRNGTSRRASPPATPEEKAQVWMAFIAMDPSNADVVVTGSSRVWRTTDDGVRWRPVSASLDGSTVSAIEIAPADPRRIYVGTENGGVFRSVDGGASWSANLAGPVLPGHLISRLATNPTDADILFATVTNFGHSHVFRSLDGGLTWQDIDNGLLPDVPHHSIAIPKDAPQTLYVCNDVGVFVSTDGGSSWADLSRNLPHVMVIDLVFQRADGTLMAATYGRSLWKLGVR